MNSTQSQIKRLSDLIKGIESVMLTTVNPDGSLNSRPMVVQDTAFNGDLWFFTARSSNKVESIEEDSQVNLAFMDPASNRYISMTGTAEIVDDPVVIKRMWSESVEEWFPDGLSNPDIVLIHVAVTRADFWDAPHSGVVETFCLSSPNLKARALGLIKDQYFHS